MVVVTEAACSGHACDRCRICTKGRCCRRDNEQYELPRESSWQGELFGRLGELQERDGRVVCHACGGDFDALCTHAWFTHNLTGTEYKAIFGLNWKTSLVGASFKAKKRVYALEQNPVGTTTLRFDTQSPIQRHARRSPNRIEGRRHHREAMIKRLGTPQQPPSVKFTEDSVRTARRLRGTGMLQREIAAELNVSRTAISDVLTGKSWSHVL